MKILEKTVVSVTFISSTYIICRSSVFYSIDKVSIGKVITVLLIECTHTKC